MNIGIIGLGFVGGAVYEGMKHAFDVVTFDKSKRIDSSVEPRSADEGYMDVLESTTGPIFVCVPTPMLPDGSCNIDIVSSVVLRLNQLSKDVDKRVVVIKSTVVPGTTNRLNEKCNRLHVCFNPEFLTERNFIDDFKNQDRIIIGGPRGGTNVLKHMYAVAYPDVPVTKTSSTIAEMIKYMTNCFLATKVAFANEMKQICDKLEIDYDKTIEYATKDERLGQSHWMVPGPMLASDDSGRMLPGFSGSCFVKDINALMSLAKKLDVDPKVMQGAWDKNLEVRPEKDWENLKGRAVI